MTVLLTGGCGYVGRQLAWALADAGRDAVILDDLSTGDRSSTPPDTPVVAGDVRDIALVRRVLRDHSVEAVVHLAGVISVAESMEHPALYYSANAGGTAALVEACVAEGIDRLVFSSTAAVYGRPRDVLVAEDHPTQPLSPYGGSKLMAETVIRDTGALTSLRSVVLRYFNVAGGDPQGRTGQTHSAASHLIINALRVAQGRQPFLAIYGDDYDTPDGTGVRDFIHVADLATAHLRALDHLGDGGPGGVFNCGYGRGYSVRDVVAAVERVTGREVPCQTVARRPGDIPTMIADPSAGREVLGWRARYDDLEAMIGSAWAWETRDGVAPAARGEG